MLWYISILDLETNKKKGYCHELECHQNQTKEFRSLSYKLYWPYMANLKIWHYIIKFHNNFDIFRIITDDKELNHDGIAENK